MVFYGFDPGGNDAFGWAAVRMGATGHPDQIETGLARNARSAIRRAYDAVEQPPIGAGIDAPLFWVSNGDRQADATVRKSVCGNGGKGGTVGHVNSLRGACLVQGALAAHEMATQWSEVPVTEAHPKALLYVWSLLADFLQEHLPTPNSDHERDALIAAYSAWAHSERWAGWEDLAENEPEPFFPGGQPVAYWFPKSVT